MSYSDATPDSPVPNPPFLQLMQANVAEILSILGLTGLAAVWNAGDIVTSAIGGANSHVGRPSRWHRAANFVPATGQTPCFFDTPDSDPDGHLVNQGGYYEYRIAAPGYYLVYNHLTLIQNSNTASDTAASIFLNGGLIAQDTTPTGLPVWQGETASSHIIDVRQCFAGDILAPWVNNAAPVATIVGGSTNSFAFATQIA